ncbi:Probable phosphoglycerate mutase GpmB [Seminavis robusta]|uniref:Probable phosphoglycerate mutase GpmB n=1 Tax=Seminavis robusta TaxID=568900 RepID=A0A9N8DVZ1_9STRA|nr:Probable phosphoglycerate mutase GpmB [Seminavis robusta]|eukprot:Sro322_g117100.1 Probable phosphoglycerate mutase GpmB (321) ;mRNA; r:56764-57726
MSFSVRGPQKIRHSRISHTIATTCMLLSTAPVASSLINIASSPIMMMTTTPRGKAFADALPPLKPFHRRVFLLRHGQTDWNSAGKMQGGGFDIPLNSHGQQQAAAVANELSGISMGAVASSHLQRALQTAHHIDTTATTTTSSEQQRHYVDARLGEMRFGDFEGTVIHGPNAQPDHQERFRQMQLAMKQNVHLKWPGADAECTWDVAQRGQAAVDALLDRQHEPCLAVVAHGRFNKILLAKLLWNDPSRYVEIEQGNTCINVIDYNEQEETWKAVLLNYSKHAPNANAKKELRRQQEELQKLQEQQQQPMEQLNVTSTAH